MEFIRKMRMHPVICGINEFVNSKYAVAFLSVLTLLANLFGWELFIYFLIALWGYYLCLFGKDMLSLAPLFVLMYITPSVYNFPYMVETTLYSFGNGLEIIVALIVIFLVLLTFRIATDGNFLNLFTVKRNLLWGFLLLFAAFFLGGIGTEYYTTDNLFYCFALSLCFFFPYFILTGMVRWKEVSKEYIAWTCVCIGTVVFLELIGAYIALPQDVPASEIIRNRVYTGWGTYTSMSAVMLISLPAFFYFSIRHRRGAIFTVWGSVILLGIYMTQCRGSILIGTVLYVVCAVYVLMQKNNRVANALVYGFALLAVSIFCLNPEFIAVIHKYLTMGNSGRTDIYKAAVECFLRSPFIGVSFCGCLEPHAQYFNPAGGFAIPALWHNTVLQMLASCGIVGLCAYAFHRVQTVIQLVKDHSIENIFTFACIFALLCTGIIDCHLFNLGCTLYYSVLLAFLEKNREAGTDERGCVKPRISIR